VSPHLARLSVSWDTDGTVATRRFDPLRRLGCPELREYWAIQLAATKAKHFRLDDWCVHGQRLSLAEAACPTKHFVLRHRAWIFSIIHQITGLRVHRWRCSIRPPDSAAESDGFDRLATSPSGCRRKCLRLWVSTRRIGHPTGDFALSARLTALPHRRAAGRVLPGRSLIA